MFGGVASNGGQTTIFAYPLLSGSCTINESFRAGVQAISPMHSPKCKPCAVFLDNKICVFPSKIQCGAMNFEVYNPEPNEWFSMSNPSFIYVDAIGVTYYHTMGSQLVIHCATICYYHALQMVRWVAASRSDCTHSKPDHSSGALGIFLCSWMKAHR